MVVFLLLHLLLLFTSTTGQLSLIFAIGSGGVEHHQDHQWKPTRHFSSAARRLHFSTFHLTYDWIGSSPDTRFTIIHPAIQKSSRREVVGIYQKTRTINVQLVNSHRGEYIA